MEEDEISYESKLSIALRQIKVLCMDANHPTRAFDEAVRIRIKQICEEALCHLQNKS